MERPRGQPARILVLLASVLGGAVLAGSLLLVERGSRETVLLLDGAGGVRALDDPGAQEIPLDGWPPRLVREPLTPALANAFYPWNALPHWDFEPIVGTRRRAHLDFFVDFHEHPARGWRLRTNSYGFRNTEEPAREKPDLRVLVAGDSQTEGLCANEETWVSWLGELLRARDPGRTVETLNAGLGGTNPYTYLGVLERYADELAPDVFVAVFYGGNDFRDALVLQSHFHRRPRRPWGEMLALVDERLASLPKGVRYAEVYQPAYFKAVPEDVEVGIGIWTAIALEMQRLCDERGTRFVCVYFPSPFDAQPKVLARGRAHVEELLAGLDIDLDLNRRMGDAWIAQMAEHGVRVLDLRPAFRAAAEHLFWRHDLHLGLPGQRVVAEALLDRFP